MIELRQLGDSNIKVTPIIFGAWAIGGWSWGGTNDRDALEAIRASIDHGVTTIDTAPVYGFGHSEKLVGQAIKGRRDKVVIATKCGMRWDVFEGSDPWPQKDLSGKEVVIGSVENPH
jgi:aryl-alcohol dehydrogenase-like predicted oxidoreductase